jgi:metal-responsive CopG/Arc/MetJ family transcriptional regulator
MKTAVSLPDDIYQRAERLARRSGKSRSQLYSEALKEYVARHGSEEITEAMDQACRELGQPEADFPSAAARRVLQRAEW